MNKKDGITGYTLPLSNFLEILRLQVLKLDDKAIIPVRANITDAGLDLFSLENVRLTPEKPVKIRTGIAIELPEGHFGMIADRSSLGSKGIKVYGGIIDNGYRGEIIVCLCKNSTADWYDIKAGDKIAQLLILPYLCPEVVEVKSLSQSDRGEKGFGSSGV